VVRRPCIDGLHEECLAQELRDREIAVARQVFVPLTYKGKRLGACYRLDLLVQKLVIVEVKAVDRLGGIHEAQMLTYLRHTGLRVGLILNFNTRVLPNGIQRISL
jgi:GxxExxY protein